MKKGKFESSGRRGFGGKTVALLLALVLVVGGVIGGTLAWLTDKTDPVTNTFTVGNIDIDLTESKNLDLKMVPGNTITKDPKVTVKANSEACWLFVKVEKSDNFDSFLTYTMASGWTQGDGTTIPSNVWYRSVETSTSAQTFDVLKDNQVTVKDTVTKAMMDGIVKGTESAPTLTVTAYASQYMKNNTTEFSAIEAWDNVKPATP